MLFRCAFCPKTFTKRSNANRHSRLHTNDKTFLCTLCPKTFFRKCNLTRHLKVHSGEKVFACNVCPKVFSLRNNLTRHLRTHSGSGVKPFKCVHCKKGFSHKSSLTRHLSRRKSCKCSVCPKAFCRCDTCLRHQQNHTVEANVEFFDCKKGLPFKALFDDFKDKRAFQTDKGEWKVKVRRNRLSKAKQFGGITMFSDLQVAVWDGTLKAGKVQLQEKFLIEEANRQREKGTYVRSNWRTPGETWEEIASWTSKHTGKRTFDFLRGKVVLEATTSDGFSTSFLRKYKKQFGFSKVVSCVDFFKYSLKERDSFDAIVTNPPWDENFLKVFYKYLLFLKKPFVLILRSRGTRHQHFQKVFGASSQRTIIS